MTSRPMGQHFDGVRDDTISGCRLSSGEQTSTKRHMENLIIAMSLLYKATRLHPIQRNRAVTLLAAKLSCSSGH